MKTITRRNLFGASGVFTLCAGHGVRCPDAREISEGGTLATIPLEFRGDWGPSLGKAAERVLIRARSVCLSGVRLLSGGQPTALQVQNRSVGAPAVWLHDESSTTAFILVNVGEADWCKLCYQFGHELGHVLCNSWSRNAAPDPPSQWLEEATVEAFSLRGLGLLVPSWQQAPPFSGDARFAQAIQEYRLRLINGYRQQQTNVALWFRTFRRDLETGRPVNLGVLVLAILSIFDAQPRSVDDLGAANRWLARTRLAPGEYLQSWERSCVQVGASGLLPLQLRRLLELA